MKTTIDGFEVWRCELPTGRVIGDCSCHYETLDVFTLALKTNQGLVGWGFGEAVSKGVFTKTAPWIMPMPGVDELQEDFMRHSWPLIQQSELSSLWQRRQELFRGFSYQSVAARTALWDLMAKFQEQPLHKLLGSENDRVRAYGSGLDFPLTDAEAAEVFLRFADRGFPAVKVKVGDPRPERDLHRLQLVREVVGENVEIAIDANEAWTCEEAIERITFFTKEGMRLSYVEDALSRDDLDGFARLNASLDIDIVGHDYILDHRELRRFVERGAFSRHDTQIIALVQAMYVIQIPFYTAGILFVRMLTSMQRNRTLFWGTGISLPLNVALNYVFMQRMGVAGIALSTSVMYAVSCAYLGFMLHRALTAVEDQPTLRSRQVAVAAILPCH